MLSVRIGDWGPRALVSAAALLLCVLGLAAIGTRATLQEPSFDAAAFREAHAAQDYDAAEAQAYRAVDDDALISKSKDEIRAMLGSPDRATRGEWRWFVGTINDEIGVGDGGALYVRFRGDRVVSTEVAVG